MSVYCVNTTAVSCCAVEGRHQLVAERLHLRLLGRPLLEVAQEVLELANLMGEVECRAIKDVEIESDIRLEGTEVVCR